MAAKSMSPCDIMMQNANECSCPICLRTATEVLDKVGASNDNTSTGSASGDCVVSNIEFVYSQTCGHIFCLSCAQKILLSSSCYINRTMHDLQDDEHLITTTQGACPMCRAELSYFDLMKVLLNETSDTKHSIVVTKSQCPVAPSDAIPNQLLGTKFWSMNGSYVQFPSKMYDTAEKGVMIYAAYLKEFVPNGILELTGCKYLSRTNTFKARAKKVATIPDSEFTIWLSFSDNFYYVTHGVIRKVDKIKTYVEIAGESYPQLRTQVKTFVYPISASFDHTLMCRATSPKNPPTLPYTKHTFWGNIFCQEFTVGVISYHFVKKPSVDGEDDGTIAAYVSYDHKVNCVWSPLDNGRPLPSRLIFRNIQCPDEYTFRGSVCWYEDYQTTWNGSSRWDYEMIFDSGFLCIRAGTVNGVKIDHENEGGSDAEIVSHLTTYGVDLHYINAGACYSIIDTMASTLRTVPEHLKLPVLEGIQSQKIGRAHV